MKAFSDKIKAGQAARKGGRQGVEKYLKDEHERIAAMRPRKITSIVTDAASRGQKLGG